MRSKRIKAVAKKEWLQVKRDTRSLLLALGIPMLMIVLFGWALKLDVDNIRTIIYDMDKTAQSRELISRFDATHYFTIVDYTDNYKEIIRRMDRGDVSAAIVIPHGFSRELKAGDKTEIQLIADGTNSLSAQILIGYVSAITTAYSETYVLEGLKRVGITAKKLPVDIRMRVWFNPELESKNFIIPGLIAVIMMIIAGLVTSLTVAREWERGTMEQLISTPIKASELVLGKLIPYVGLGFFDFILAVSVGTLIFGVPLKGNLVLLFVLSVVFLIGAMAFGILISINAKKQLMASQIAILTTFLPAFLLSGFVFPISNMPYIIQAITYVIPARYFVTILKGIFLKGVGVSVLFAEGFFLLVFTLVVVSASVRRFKKELQE
jgi:ABC-2 type transport system permease protein